MKTLKITFGIILLSVSIWSCKKSIETVEIGNQRWMVKNLNLSHFRNGDSIIEVKTNEEWKKAGDNGQPAWCYYDYDPSNGVKYGKLYNWYAVHDERGLAPFGWHIPSDDEWTELTNNQGGKDKAGIIMKSMMMWNDYENEREEGVFEGLPGGIRLNGKFVIKLEYTPHNFKTEKTLVLKFEVLQDNQLLSDELELKIINE